MLKVNEYNNQIVLKNDNIFLAIGFGGLVMAFVAIKGIFVDFGPIEKPATAGDIFGWIFLSVWFSVVLGMSIIGFTIAGNKVIIDSKGIHSKNWLYKRELLWCEVKDWGLSYCGQTRGEGNTYYFYFSDKEHPIKNSCKKNLKGKMIKITIMESDYIKYTDTVIPFCAQKTGVKPFIGENKYHII